MYLLWAGCNNTNNQEMIRGKLSMGLGGITSFLIFEKIEEIIKQQGIGIEKNYSKIYVFQFSMPKMEQTILPESVNVFLTCTISVLQTAEWTVCFCNLIDSMLVLIASLG